MQLSKGLNDHSYWATVACVFSFITQPCAEKQNHNHRFLCHVQYLQDRWTDWPSRFNRPNGNGEGSHGRHRMSPIKTLKNFGPPTAPKKWAKRCWAAWLIDLQRSDLPAPPWQGRHRHYLDLAGRAYKAGRKDGGFFQMKLYESPLFLELIWPTATAY